MIWLNNRFHQRQTLIRSKKLELKESFKVIADIRIEKMYSSLSGNLESNIYSQMVGRKAPFLSLKGKNTQPQPRADNSVLFAKAKIVKDSFLPANTFRFHK